MITSLYILGLCKARTACSNNGCLTICYIPGLIQGFPDGSDGKESACNVGELGSIPGLGRSLGEGKGDPLQYSGLENSMDCIVHGFAKSRTQLSDFHKHRHFYIKPSFSSGPTHPSRCCPCFSYQPVSFLPEHRLQHVFHLLSP